MLFLFTTFRYLPTSYLAEILHIWCITKNNVIWAVLTISPTGYNTIWYACDERKLFFPFRFEGCLGGGRSGHLGTFYFLLNRADWSWWFYYFNFFVYFSKDLGISKMLFQKIKPIISSCFLTYKKKLSRNY